MTKTNEQTKLQRKINFQKTTKRKRKNSTGSTPHRKKIKVEREKRWKSKHLESSFLSTQDTQPCSLEKEHLSPKLRHQRKKVRGFFFFSHRLICHACVMHLQSEKIDGECKGNATP